jgi:hypothetical protein
MARAQEILNGKVQHLSGLYIGIGRSGKMEHVYESSPGGTEEPEPSGQPLPISVDA